MAFDPNEVRVGPGILYIAPLETPYPTDITTAWDSDWVALGYTDAGSTVELNNTFEDVMVAEELEAVQILQTQRQVQISFALAQVTAQHLSYAFNGGEVDDNGTYLVFTPQPAGEYTPVMIGWESTDGLERLVFYRCIQVGSVSMARQKAPAKATIPCTFRATKPGTTQSFSYIQDKDYVAAGSS